MFQAKFAIIKCVTALVVALSTVTAMVAFAATDYVNKVTITDGDNSFEVETYCSNVSEILSENQITLSDGDVTEFELKDGVGTLKIMRSFPVHITYGNEKYSTNMTEGTVAKALQSAGLTLGEYDMCNKNLEDVLTAESYIDVVSVEYKTVTYEESIPFTTKVEYSNKLNKGDTKVTEGEEGSKTVTVKQRVENGVVTSVEVLSENVTKQATTKTTVIGTKKATVQKQQVNDKKQTEATGKVVETISEIGDVKVDANGVPLKYSKAMTFRASAYTSPKGALCSTGVAAKPGYIAVNPNIIPYGTKMYIVSNDGKYVYGYAIAADTGGFAKRNPYMVDLYFNTESACINFGIRNVTIYVLE